MIALFLATLAGLCAMMAIGWAVQRSTRATGWIDVTWSLATGLAGIVLSLWPLAWATGSGAVTDRQIVVAVLVAIWSARLTWQLTVRTLHKPDDARYAKLRDEWGADYDKRIFFFLQIQAVCALLLALSHFFAARRPGELDAADAAGILVLLVAMGGAYLADAQLHRFATNPANRGKICEEGLWAWSRHPNYFFEWLAWLAFPVIAIDLSGAYPWGWGALVGPAFMYWLLVHVSGIPPLEEHMLRSRGDAFRDLRRRVNAFFPWPPKRQTSH